MRTAGPGNHGVRHFKQELPIKRKIRKDVVRRVTISGIDRQTAESLYLELRRLRKEEGVELVRFVVKEDHRKR